MLEHRKKAMYIDGKAEFLIVNKVCHIGLCCRYVVYVVVSCTDIGMYCRYVLLVNVLM